METWYSLRHSNFVLEPYSLLVTQIQSENHALNKWILLCFNSNIGASNLPKHPPLLPGAVPDSKVLWEVAPRPEHSGLYYNFSSFTMRLNEAGNGGEWGTRLLRPALLGASKPVPEKNKLSTAQGENWGRDQDELHPAAVLSVECGLNISTCCYIAGGDNSTPTPAPRRNNSAVPVQVLLWYLTILSCPSADFYADELRMYEKPKFIHFYTQLWTWTSFFFHIFFLLFKSNRFKYMC